MDLVVGLAIGVLCVVFLASLFALILLCVQRRRTRRAFADRKPILKYSRTDIADNPAGSNGSVSLDSEFDDMLQLSPNIAKALRDHEFLYDAPGLVHHCLSILRVCHQTSDRLSTVSVPPAMVAANAEVAVDVQYWTKKVMPRVEDLVRAAYQCGRQHSAIVQASLLEARAAALVLTMAGVATAFRAAYPRHVQGDLNGWLRDAQRQMEQHLEALRLAAWHEEAAQREKVQLVYESGGNGSGTAAGPSTSNTSSGKSKDAARLPPQQQSGSGDAASSNAAPGGEPGCSHQAGTSHQSTDAAGGGKDNDAGDALPPTPPPPAPGPTAESGGASGDQPDDSDQSSAPEEPTVDGPTIMRPPHHNNSQLHGRVEAAKRTGGSPAAARRPAVDDTGHVEGGVASQPLLGDAARENVGKVDE